MFHNISIYWKEAHTTSRIGGINTRLEKYNSVDELKHKRENIVKLSQNELEELEVYKQYKKKQDENKRQAEDDVTNEKGKKQKRKEATSASASSSHAKAPQTAQADKSGQRPIIPW